MVALLYSLALIAVDDAVNGFQSTLNDRPLQIVRNANRTLTDAASGTVWDLRGQYLSGALGADLQPIALSDEYWFSWKRFHPTSQLVRVARER